MKYFRLHTIGMHYVTEYAPVETGECPVIFPKCVLQKIFEG